MVGTNPQVEGELHVGLAAIKPINPRLGLITKPLTRTGKKVKKSLERNRNTWSQDKPDIEEETKNPRAQSTKFHKVQ